MNSENWDDLRFVLCVVETGSVLQASKRLGVSHATVLRRIAAFEDRHSTAVFDRTAHGYRLLPDQVPVIRAAQQAQSAMAEVGRLASGGQVSLQGSVRIASTDTLSSLILPEFVERLHADAPDLSISLLCGNAYLDLARAQANVVIRPSVTLGEDLIGETLCTLGFAAYAVSDAPDRWFSLLGPLARSVAAHWMQSALREADLTTGSDSFLTLKELAIRGQGIALLPCFLGDCDPRLQRLPDATPPLAVPIWMARHADVPETPQMRAVQAKLVDFFQSKQAVLAG